MSFDSADVANMIAGGSFLAVVLHEMGHVIGIGTQWNNYNLVDGSFNYLGAQGAAGLDMVNGAAGPSQPLVENTGGPGT